MDRRGSTAGQHWEDKASRFVESRGVQILTRSYACKFGEIDLIGCDDQYLIFFEVKARSDSRFGVAAHSIDRKKQRRIIKTAEHFLARNPQYAARPLRVDVVTFDRIESQTPKVQWIKNAIEGS